MKYRYINKIKELISNIEDIEFSNMNKCTNILVEAILNNKSIYTFGASHAGIISEELFYRAGGLMLINPIFAKELMLDNVPVTITSKMERCAGYGEIIASKYDFKNGDILILHSVSGRNPIIIELAIKAKNKGCIVIGITNLTYSKNVSSRHHSKKNLYEYCDLILNNHGEIGDACIEIPGIDQKVGPTSTITMALIMNNIIVETVLKLKEKGIDRPPVFYSANLDNKDHLNEALYKKYKKSIHYKL